MVKRQEVAKSDIGNYSEGDNLLLYGMSQC